MDSVKEKRELSQPSQQTIRLYHNLKRIFNRIGMEIA